MTLSRFKNLTPALTLGLLWALTASAQVEPIQEVFTPTGTYDPKVYGKVAVVQWNPPGAAPIGATQAVVDAFKEQNRQTLAGLIREAARNGAEMVITPEFGIVGYPDIPELPSEEDEFRNRDDIRPYVEPIPGTTSNFFSALARELKIYLQVSFAEVEPATDRYYNVGLAFDPTGNIVGKYHKMNLYQAETNFLSPGTQAVTYDSPFGKVGMVICADVYSNQPTQAYCNLGVKVLALSTSWAQWNTGMGTFQNAARRCNAYLLAANQTYFPDSGVINPDGTNQSHIRQTDGIAYGFLKRLKPAAKKGGANTTNQPVNPQPVRRPRRGAQ